MLKYINLFSRGQENDLMCTPHMEDDMEAKFLIHGQRQSAI